MANSTVSVFIGISEIQPLSSPSLPSPPPHSLPFGTSCSHLDPPVSAPTPVHPYLLTARVISLQEEGRSSRTSVQSPPMERAKSNPDVGSVFRTCSKLSWTKPICFTAPVDLPSYSKLKIKVLKVALGAQQKPVPSDLPLGTSPRPPCMPGAPLSWTSSPKPPEGAWLLESPPGPRASPRLPSRRGLPSLALLLSPNTLYPLPSATAPTWRMQHPLAGLRPGSPWKRKLPKAGTLSLFADLLMT